MIMIMENRELEAPLIHECMALLAIEEEEVAEKGPLSPREALGAAVAFL
jgi:hypothetical protein